MRIPHASTFSNPSHVPNAVVIAISRLNEPVRRIAVQLHRIMNMVKEAQEDRRKQGWLIVLRGVLRAHKNGELRQDVRERFEAECPKAFKDIWFRYRSETGALEKPDRQGKSPLGSKTKPVDKAELVARRLRRVENSPAGRHESAPDPHGKGKNKKK